MWHLSPKNRYCPRHFPAYQCVLNLNMNRNQALCVAVVILLLQSISIRQQQIVAFFILYMRWINSYQAMLNIATIRRRNRTLRRQHIAPYQWSIPRPAESWFEIHYNDPTVPQEYFRQQLRVYKNTFDLIRNIHGLRYHAIANHELFYRCDRQVMTFRAAVSFV